MSKIKVGIIGVGTIGKRVADAVMLQDDMELAGITVRSYNYRAIVAAQKKVPLFVVDDSKENFTKNGIPIEGDINELLENVDIVVDCAPKKVGAADKEKYYLPKKIKAIFQGGEKAKVAECSFVAQCNYDEAVNKDYIRVVSCNTTGLCRTLQEVNKLFGIKEAYATMIRRGADPWDIRHGPINAVVPVLELPSHHGPDVQTVLKGLGIFTTALSVSSTLMHLHTLTVECKKKPNVEDTVEAFRNATRVRVVDNASMVRSTAEIMEYAKDLERSRGDMPEIVVWKEAVGATNNKLLYMQAVHQESDVICENIDAIRAAMGFEDAAKSIEKTNKALNIDIGKYETKFLPPMTDDKGGGD